jgi:hypothetical protein
MPGLNDVGRGGPTVVEPPQAPVAEEQVVCVEGTELQLVPEGNIASDVQQKNILGGKDGSGETFPQTVE